MRISQIMAIVPTAEAEAPAFDQGETADNSNPA
jgi:hypothetical protein